MPWKESSVMDERLRFVARLLDGESMTEVCRDFGISRKLDTRSSTATRSTASKRSPTARAGRSGSPINCRPSSRHASSPSSARSNTGVLGRSVSCWFAIARRRTCPRQEHHPRRAASARARRPARSPSPPRHGNAAVARSKPQRTLVYRLQGRIQARQWTLLLSPHRHRSCLALPVAVRGPGVHPRGPRHHGVRTPLPLVACQMQYDPTPEYLFAGPTPAPPTIAVGTQVTPRPPLRSVQAQLRHTAPTSGE